MARAALFLAAQARQVFLVIATQIVFAHADAGGHAVEVEHHVFHAGLLWLLELAAIGFVVSLQVGVAGHNAAGEIGGVEVRDLHFAALQECVERGFGLRGRGKGRAHDAGHHLVDREVAPHHGFETLGRHALRADQGAVGGGIQAAVGALERGDRGDFLQAARKAAVARDEVHFLRGGLQHALAHEAL